MNGADACGQGLLQVMQHIGTTVFHRGVIQQLFKRLQLYENRHVLQKVALDVGRKLRCFQELHVRGEKTILKVFNSGSECDDKKADKWIGLTLAWL